MNWPEVLLVPTLSLSFIQATAVPCPLPDGGPGGRDGNRRTSSVEPWEFRPEPGDDKIRRDAIHLVREIISAMQQRSAAFSLPTPQKGSDEIDLPTGPNDLTSSRILSHVNQGAIWTSILLSAEPSLLSEELREFRRDLEQHLQDYSKTDPGMPKRWAKEAKCHEPSNKSAAEEATDAEISYQELVSNLQTLSPDYARMFQYQSPRVLNRPGDPTMFALFDPRITDLGPLKRGELMVSFSIAQVTQIDKGRFRIEAYDAYREIWDWEGYLARDPTKGVAGGQAWSVHNSPPFELDPDEAYISRSPKEVLTLDFAKGFSVITGTISPMVRESAVLRKVELQQAGFDPTQLISGSTSARPAKQSAPRKTPLSEPVAEARASALPSAQTPVPAPTPPASVAVPTTKIAAFFQMDTNLALHGATPTSEEQAKVVQDVVDNWLTPYFLNATGPEAEMLRMAMPNSNGTMPMHFSVSPAPKDPKDPPTILFACTFEWPGDPATLISCTQTGLSVALPKQHFERPGEVLLDLVGVLISNLPSQDKQNGEAVKRSFGKFLSNINANINRNHSVPSDVLAKLGVEATPPGKFISADIPEHPTGALGIYDPEEQGMAYRIVDFFNLLLKEEDYLRRTGHPKEFETTQALLAALPSGLVVHFSIRKEDDPRTRVKKKEHPLPESSPTDIHISLPEHAYKPTKDDFKILRDALAEAIAKSQAPGGPTGPEISSLLDDFLVLYSTDPHNHNILVEVIKWIYTPSSAESQ